MGEVSLKFIMYVEVKNLMYSVSQVLFEASINLIRAESVHVHQGSK